MFMHVYLGTKEASIKFPSVMHLLLREKQFPGCFLVYRQVSSNSFYIYSTH